MKKKKLLSIMLMICMILSVTIPSIPGGGKAAAAERADDADTTEATVIDVTKYGADPTGVQDSAEGIQAAIEAAKQAEGPVVLDFPKGEYQIYPDRAQKRELYISNTLSSNNGDRSTYKMKNIGILLENMENVTLEGNQSSLIFHGKMMMFSTIGCKNVKIQNFDTDFQVPSVVSVTAEKVEGNTATLYVPECYNYSVSGTTVTWSSDVSPYTGAPYWSYTNGVGHVQGFDMTTGTLTTSSDKFFSNVKSIEKVDGHRLKVTYNSTPSFKAGYGQQMRRTTRDHAAAFLWESDGVSMQHVDLHFLHAFGVVGQLSKNITLDDVNFRNYEGSGRTGVGSADFVQMSGCGGTIRVVNSTFEDPQDDPINIHGTFLQVTERISANKFKVRYQHHETSGFPNYYVGDEVEFVSKSSLLPISGAKAKVTGVVGPDGHGGTMVEGNGDAADTSKTDLNTIIVTLDTDMPSSVSANAAALENVTYTPSVEIENNVFREMPVRGILVTTRKPVVIRNNEFDNVAGAAIYISDDVNGWYESGHDEDVLIEKNVFRRCGVNQGNYSAFIMFDPTVNGSASPVHKNVRIKDNEFYFTNRTANVVNAKSVDGLTFTGNKVLRFSVNEKANPAKTILAVGETVSMNVSTAESASINAFTFNGCRNVNISDNVYDKGVNRNVNISNMQNSEVTIGSNENVTIGSGTQAASEMIYVSSDPETVRVDGTGHVTGVKTGTATVTAYELVGGRKFSTDPVSFTVTEGEAQNPVSEKILSRALTVKNPTDGGYSVSGESVTIKAMGQGLWNTQVANNIIVSGENTDRGTGKFTAIVKMSGKTVRNYDEAGLFLYKDNDNYVAVQRKHGNGTPKIHVVTETNKTPDENQNTSDSTESDIWLKLVKSGDTFTGYYSTNKTDWTPVGNSITNSAIGNSFGVALVAGTGNNTKGTPFTFSDLEINGEKIALTEDAPTGGDSGDAEKLKNVKSGNAILASAAVSGVTMPAFSSDTKSYVTTAGKDVKSVNLSLKAKDENAKIEICRNGVGNAVKLANENEIVSAENGGSEIKDQKVDLVAGLNIITARVIAEDGHTQEIYRFLITRTGAQNAAISGITVDGKDVAGFKTDEKSYSASLTKGQKTVTIQLKDLGEGAKAVLNVNGTAYNAGDAIPVSGDTMVAGIAITPDGGVTEHYSLTLRVPSDSNAKLEKVQFGSSIQNSGNFNANLKEYTASTMTKTSKVAFTAQEANAKITVKCNNETVAAGTGSVETPVTMKKGSNQLQVTVESTDKSTTETYTWTVEGKSEVYLSDLSYESNSATGWGSIMKDKTVDGKTLTLYDGSQEKTFEKGMGIHATANLYYNIEGMGFKKFVTYMGVDREANSEGNVKFNVYTDDKQVYTGDAVTRESKMISLDIPVEGVKILRLNVDKNGSDSNDHADFADAKFITELADDTTPETVAVTGVTLDKSTAKLTAKGRTVDLTATVAPENATNKKVTFTTSNEKVATVDANGKVTAAGNGTATITVTTEDGKKTATCEVTVEISTKEYTLPTGEDTLEVEAEDFVLYPLNGDTEKHVHAETAEWASGGKFLNWFEAGDKISMNFDAPEAGEYEVTASYRSGCADISTTNNAFNWEGTNVESGSVDVIGETGATTTHTVTFTIKVTQAGKGVLSFIANSSKKGPQTDKFVFKKKAETPAPTVVAVTGVTLDKSTAKLTAKGRTVDLTATVAPENATNKKVTFTTSNEKVATVDANGKVTAAGNGTATITVTTEDGKKTAACEVTVEIPAAPDPAPEELVDEVKKEIAAAESKKESDYTEATWKTYDEALKKAEKAVKEGTASKEEMQKILKDLRDAASALTKKEQTPSTNPQTPSTNPQTPSTNPDTSKDDTAKVGQVIKADAQYGVFTYTITGKDTVEVNSITAKGKAKKNVKIFAKIKSNGKTYKVTSVGANALKGCKKMTSLTIEKNVRKIGKNAFANCKNLKKITVKSKKINTIGKNAFKGISKKAAIKVPKAQKKKYTKLLNKAKLSKKVKIK